MVANIYLDFLCMCLSECCSAVLGRLESFVRSVSRHFGNDGCLERKKPQKITLHKESRYITIIEFGPQKTMPYVVLALYLDPLGYIEFTSLVSASDPGLSCKVHTTTQFAGVRISDIFIVIVRLHTLRRVFLCPVLWLPYAFANLRFTTDAM